MRKIKKLFSFVNKRLLRKAFILLMVLSIYVPGFLSYLPQNSAPVLAATQTYTSQADFMAGKYEFNEIDPLSSAGDIQLQADLGNWDASAPAYLNHNVNTNTKLIRVGNFLYAFRNRQLGQFVRYDLSTREWKEMAYTPDQPYEVIDATSNHTDTIWAFATRSGRKHFLKYYVPTDTWTYLDTTPLTLTQGSTLQYVAPNYVYAFQGGGTSFWRYNITNNAWSQLANAVATCTNYCSLEYDGSQYMYLATDAGAPDGFFRYDTINGGVWVAQTSMPIDGAMNYGSDLIKAGSSYYVMRSAGTNTFYKFTAGTWTTVRNVPFVTTYGSMAYDDANNQLIVMGGVGELAYYYPATNTWSNPMTGPPANGYQTANAITSDGAGNIYMCRGQTTTTCYKYVIATDTWTATTVATGTLGTGTSLTYVNSKLYTTRGATANNIYSYDGAAWATPTAPPAQLGDGSAMVASGSGATGAIFAVQGGAGTGFYRYDVTGNSWLTKTATLEPVYRGSGLAQAGMFTYLLNGGMRGKFYRYHETTNGWEELPSLPVGSYEGGGLISDGGNYIYAMVGGENDVWSRRIYRYSISGATWTRMADAPGMMRFGGGMTFYNGTIYAYNGYGGSFWKYTPPTTTYKASGTWYSAVQDLTYVSSFGNYTTTDTKPGGTGVSYYTRTSDNQNTWDDWSLVSGTTINSTPRRYVQTKAVLTGNGTATPTISDIAINYTGDTSVPDIGSLSLSAKAQKGSGTTITTGNTYNYTNPYFSWSGVTDTESGIDGYYVYFGSSASGDPVTLGNFQQTTDYVVNTPMVAGTSYYLRIAPKNKAGTTPVADTYFTYIYNGNSPATTSLIATTQDQWDATDASKSGTYAANSAWWNHAYQYRRQLTITSPQVASPGATIKVTLDTDALVTAGKMRSDRNDWRITYWDGTFWKEVNRQYIDATTTYFPLVKGIAIGASDNNYYAYYGNNSETKVPDQTFDPSALSKWGSALRFGGDDYVKIPAGFNTSVNTQSKLTIEGWFKYFNSASARWIYGDNNAAPQIGIGIPAGANWMTYNFKTATAGTFTGQLGTTLLVPETCYHVAVVYDATAGTFNAYINGRLDATRSALSGNVSIGVTQQYLGGSSNAWHYGTLDEFRVLNVAQYPGPFTPPAAPFNSNANTLLLYHFDATGTQNVTDSSSSGFTGTLGLNAWGLEATDPNWTGDITASPGSEVGAPQSAADTTLSLEPLPEGSWAGSQVSSLPYGVRMQYGATTVVNNDLYVLRGNNTTAFYKQDITTGTWTQLTDIPLAANYGSAMEWDGADAIYVIRGNVASTFYKYTISTNTWSAAIDQPIYTFSYGASITRIGNMFYIAAGGNGATMLSFNKNYESTIDGNDAWSTLQSAPYNIYYGAGIAYDGNNTLWLVAGNGTGFAKYSISADTWDTTVSAPVLAPYFIGYSSNNAIFRNNHIYTFTSYDFQANGEAKHFLWSYDIATDKWEKIDNATEFWAYTGATAYDRSRYVYLVQGYGNGVAGNTTMVRYDLELNKYLPETPPLPQDRIYEADGTAIVHQVSTGTSMAYDGNDYIYMIQGSAANTVTPVNRYQVSTKRWTMIPNIPCSYSGGAVYAGNKLYAVCGNGTKKSYSYDPLANEWTMLANNPGNAAETITSGGSQIAVYNGTDALYVLRGGTSNTLYKYTIGTNTWTTESTIIPGTIGPNYGASITYDGSRYLYVMRGNNTGDVYRYDTSTPGWTTLTSVPETVSNGSGSVLSNGKIYVTTSYNNNSLYMYDIATNSWQSAPLAQSQIAAGGTLVKGPGNSMYALQGNTMFTFWKYNLPSATSSYKSTGNYISRTVDLGKPYAFSGLTATVASPSATSIGFETRTSTDATTWSSWAATSDLKQNPTNQFIYKINSPVARYMQTRVTMNSEEGAATPTVSDMSIEYYQDTTAPTNPSGVIGYTSATKSATITDSIWYNHNHPYFEWTGSTDGNSGSGVGGYYVYFGTDSAKIASISGVFTSQANYTATLATDHSQDGFYYLNVQAVDVLGNIAAPTTSLFTYRYIDTVSPNNPNVISAFADNTKIASLSAAGTTWYNYARPYFEWSGATDDAGGSGVAGYYVYFGTNQNALASQSGTFQTGTSYNPTMQTDGSDAGDYYLNIQTRDAVGNVAASNWTSFHYKHIDRVAPTNPNALGSYADITKLNPLTPGGTTWYNYAHPYFEWTGATDEVGGSGIAGYYVYFGTNPNAVASQSGVFQTGSTYSPTMQTDGSDAGEYYLIIQSKDTGGNSATSNWNAFHYKHSDSVPPNNPNNISGYSDITKITSITEGTWYNYAHPYFEWTGATDDVGGSGIAGYYVYFGTNPSAVASQSGVFQLGSTYSPTMQTNGSDAGDYYLIIQSKDTGGNAAASNWTAFHYNHIDVTAPTIPTTLSSYTTASKSAVLSPDIYYNNSSPYFEWTGATDEANGSGIAGYYVYFGSDPYGVASTSGTFVTQPHFTASLATNSLEDGDHYLIIQTKDTAGNISYGQWKPFHYVYDHTPPTVIPSENVAVLPNGYTSVNNYRFIWDATDDPLPNGAGVGFKGYYYKTGTGSGALSQDIFTTGLTVTGITAYQEGINTFLIRAADNLGNYSNYTTVNYYFNSTAPSAPKNLSVDVSNAGANKFNFVWDEPATYKGTMKEYRYSVNEVPNAANISTASGRLVNNIKGTHDGTNTFYVVGVDDAYNVNYGNYASKTFSVSVSAPGIPLAPEAFDNSIRTTAQYRVGLTWDPPTDKGTAFDRYEVYASETKGDCSVAMTGYTLAGSTAGTSYVATSIGETNLSSKAYYFCILACATTNQCSSPSTTVTMTPSGRWLVAPDLVGSQSATVKTKSALVSWNTSRSSNSFVKYGKSSGSYSTEVGSSTQASYHEINITGLDPGTTYYYQMLWTDEDGNLGKSTEKTFSTNPAPFVSAVKFSRVNINSAQVTFTIKSGIKATIQYGKTLSYGSIETISTSKSESTYTVEIPNLLEGTAYHLRIAAEDDEANIYYSDDYTFETLPTPKIIGLRMQQVVGMPTATVRLLWTTNTLASSIVTYYPTKIPQQATDNISLALKKTHDVILKNLLDDTDYTIIIKGKDSSGNEAKAETKVLKTASDVRPPEIQNLNVESTIIGVGEEARAQIVVSWDTDEPSTTQIEYGQGTGTTYNQTTQLDSNKTSNHIVTITGLSPSKIYHLRALSKDKADNLAQSLDTVIITPKSTKDALNLVIDNLSKTFGFLRVFTNTK